jgi:hypothetical protein
MQDEFPSRLESWAAYSLSALTMLVWVGCVVPAGPIPGAAPGGDLATPIHREAILLVPALLLLVLLPASCTLSRRRRGMRAVLASTDAFVTGYAATALWAHGFMRDIPSLVAVILLFSLSGLSGLEAWRCNRATDGTMRQSRFTGTRLAVCLLALILPLHLLLHPDAERASLLAPFFFVAVSAGGVSLARDLRGFRRAAAVLQLVIATHMLVTLRYTMFRATPSLSQVEMPGQVTLGLATGVLGLAVVQLLLLSRKGPPISPPPENVNAAVNR